MGKLRQSTAEIQSILDNAVSGQNIKTINGESVIGEGDLRVGVKNVESVEALETLDAVVGDIATVGNQVTFSARYCYRGTASEIEEAINNRDFERFTKICGVNIVGVPSEAITIFLGASDEFVYLTYNSTYGGTATIYSKNSTDGFELIKTDGTINALVVNQFNERIKSKDYRYVGVTLIDNNALSDTAFDVLDSFFLLQGVAADAYIKSDSWKRLLKEGDVTGGGESCSCIEEVIFYAADNVRGYTLTAEEKAKNVEAYNKQYQAYHDKTPLNRIVCVRGDVTLFMPVTYFIPAVSTNGTTLNVIKSGGLDEFYVNVSYDGSATYSEKKGLDEVLSTTSQNPVQNKVITSALNDKADKSYVDEKVANISSEEGLEYRKLYAKGDAFGIVTGELTAEQKAYNIETINLYKQNKAIIGYEQVIGGISRITLCKGTDSNGEATNFYFAHVLNASVLISIAISADGSGTYQSDNGLLIDSELSETSTNPVQNKVVTTALVTLEEGYALNAQQIGVLKTTKADKTYVDEKIANKQDTISDLATIRSNATLGSTAIQKVKTINGESITGDGNVELFTKALYDELVENMLENEEVYAAAVNDLNTRVENNRQHSETTYATKAELLGEITDMTNSIVENEEVIAATLNDLLARIDALVTRVEQLENA